MEVIEIKDQIVRISLGDNDNLIQGEILLINEYIEAYLISAAKNEAYLILFSNDNNDLQLGDPCVSTGKTFSVDIPRNILGNIWNYNLEKYSLHDNLLTEVNPFTFLKNEDANLIEQEIEPPISYIDVRRNIDSPLESGTFTIDTSIPIGKGQRELIIGDRQTGKTAIALDAIFNQRNKNVICLYVAIGKKRKEILDIYLKLVEHRAISYTAIFSAIASDGSIQQFLIPYVATLVAEKFRDQGHDVLIVYDDLSKHAKAYRTFSLLTGASPGREAYPGDIFYIHSRLLERAGAYNEKLGNGTITALPIVETQLDIITNYIETNIISITDGQIVTSTKLRNSGFKPSIDIANSVSRVGSSARFSIMNQEVSNFKSIYSQYLALKSFVTSEEALPLVKKQLFANGKILEALFLQPNEKPYHNIFIWLISLLFNEGIFQFFEPQDITFLKRNLLEFIDNNIFAQNFLKLIYDAKSYRSLSPSVDKETSRDVVAYYCMEAFAPVVKRIGLVLYRDDKVKVNQINLLLANYQEAIFEFSNEKIGNKALDEDIKAKIIKLRGTL